MDDSFQAHMAEATRLTGQGRLAEATALIQRALAGAAAPAAVGPRATAQTVDPTLASALRLVAAPPAPERGTTADTTSTPRGLSASDTRPFPDGALGWVAHPGRPPGHTRRGHPAPTAPPSGVGEGQFIDGSFTHPAGTRTYKLYIPRGVTSQAVPLVVMLHGCTQTPDDFAAGTRMNALADRYPMLVAYPAQAVAAHPTRCWNWFAANHQLRGQGEPALLAGLTHHLLATSNVDAGRVYVAGLSAGGAMAVVLAAAYPDLYAAVGVHSGLAYGSAGDLRSALTALQRGGAGATGAALHSVAAAGVQRRVVPLLVFHGDQDTTVHPRNADQMRAQWAAAYAASDDPTVSRGQVPGGHAYTRSVYHDAAGQAIVEDWRVHGLGHAWSGGGAQGSYTDPRGPDASGEMVRFFQEHARR
jgi:poly(hydroxyalkanoate) depolymerase family esterase